MRVLVFLIVLLVVMTAVLVGAQSDDDYEKLYENEFGDEATLLERAEEDAVYVEKRLASGISDFKQKGFGTARGGTLMDFMFTLAMAFAVFIVSIAGVTRHYVELGKRQRGQPWG